MAKSGTIRQIRQRDIGTIWRVVSDSPQSYGIFEYLSLDLRNKFDQFSFWLSVICFAALDVHYFSHQMFMCLLYSQTP